MTIDIEFVLMGLKWDIWIKILNFIFSDDDDPWAKKSKKKKNKKNDKKSKKNGAAVKKEKVDPFQEKYAHLFANAADKKPKVEEKKPLPGLLLLIFKTFFFFFFLSAQS